MGIPQRQAYPLIRRTIWSANVLSVAVGTTGRCGGDVGHGCETTFQLQDLAGTCIKVTPTEDKTGNVGVTIQLGGDAELATFAEALEWAAKTLKTLLNNADHFGTDDVEVDYHWKEKR